MPRIIGVVLGSASFVSFLFLEVLVFTRLGLAIPAIALDDPVRAMRTAWWRGQRNSFRLLFGAVFCVVPFFALAEFLLFRMLARGIAVSGASGAVPADPHAFLTVMLDPTMIVFLVPIFVVDLVGGGVLLAFYAFAYGQLASNWNPPPALAAA